MSALADKVPGVALATLPVDVMKTTPDDCCTGYGLEPNQLYALPQNKASHYVPISDFHRFGSERFPIFSPSHPFVKFVPGLSNRSRRNCPIANLFGPDDQARSADWHRNVNQYRFKGGHTQTMLANGSTITLAGMAYLRVMSSKR
jgi:hypothetical protein